LVFALLGGIWLFLMLLNVVYTDLKCLNVAFYFLYGVLPSAIVLFSLLKHCH